jgi:hypothetical protein
MEENDERARDIPNIYSQMRRVEHLVLDPTQATTLAKERDRVV